MLLVISFFAYLPLSSASSILGNNSPVISVLGALASANQVVYTGPWTATTSGLIDGIHMPIYPSPTNVYAAIYTDNSNSPGTLIETSASVGVANGTDSGSGWTIGLWNGFTTNFTSGQKYWFAFLSNAGWGLGVSASGSWTYRYQNGISYHTFPATAAAATGASYNSPVVWATILDPYNYSYTFRGVYDENTNSILGSCNVTANFADGTPPQSFIVNNTYIFHPNTQPSYFEYNIQSYANTTDPTITRQYWLKPDETSGNYNIFGDQTGLVHIIFQIRALGGVGLSSLLEVQRLINGTYQTVEQRQVDVNGIATMSLQPYTIYRVIAWSGSTSTTFGNINTYTTAITLTLSALSFPSDILLQYKYLRIWASRPSPTEIQISYEDTNSQTISVAYQIAFANGTVAYNATHTGENSFIDNWAGADSNTTYYLTANTTQITFGTSTFAQIPSNKSLVTKWRINTTLLFALPLCGFSSHQLPVFAAIISSSSTENREIKAALRIPPAKTASAI